MESWILYYDKTYEALPWPYGQPWGEVVSGGVPLLHACEDLGIVSPTDGATEIPSVPPDLPRGVPQGRYRLAIHHDADYLYVLLDAVEGPVAVSRVMFERQLQVPVNRPAIVALILMSSDGRFSLRFDQRTDGTLQFKANSLLYGPRKQSPPDATPDWQCIEQVRADGERTGWRIRRSSLPPGFGGETVRLSVSRMGFRNLEYVAWGGGAVWGPRPDEMGTVKLVTERSEGPCPVCRRIDLEYEPRTESGRFRLAWKDLYRPGEAVTDVVESDRVIPSEEGSFRLNGRQQLVAFADDGWTDTYPIPDGHNFVEASTVGERSTRLYFEKRSGHSIPPCPYPAPTPMSREELAERARATAAAALAEHRNRQAKGDALDFRHWPMIQAASAGRAYAWLDKDPSFLDLLRLVADETLAFQRPDGTYSAFHLAARWKKLGIQREVPRWAGGAYDSGRAGELWTVAAWQLGDDKYLEASRKLVHAYEQYRIEFNHNYGAFALFHLAAYYRLTRDPLALEHGRFYARHIAAKNLLPLGFQAGHNFYSCYGFITLRGLANFCRVLPECDPYREELRELCVRMANQLLTRLQSDGNFDARDRYFIGERQWITGLFSVAQLLAGDDLKRLDDALQCVLQAPVVGRRRGLLDSEAIRYMQCREALLRGETIDWLKLV